MGRLIGLELKDFKSYRGVSTIGFGSSFFTSIIGPNGAGKSNMMDAISFVLGVQSAHLRSSQLKDLIYRGRKSTNAPDSTLDNIEQDPTKAYVMAIYEKDDGQVLKLKRSISSNGSSDYRINDQSVTALNYSMVLKAENILIKARNFLVFQGDVEQIASQSPKELTQLIETISGSAEFTKEYESLKEEHEKAHELSNSVFSRRRTLNSESKQYKEQMAEQKEFEEKLTQKSYIIKSMNLYKLYHNEKTHNQLVQDLKNKTAELKLLKRQLSTQESAYKNLMAEYSKLVLESKQNKANLAEIALKIETTKRELIPIEANKKSLSNKINNIKSKIKDITNDYNRQKQQNAQIEKQLKDAERMFSDFQNKIANSTSSSISAAGQKEYESLRSQFLASEGSQLEEEVTLLLNEKDSIESNVENLITQASNSSSRINELERIISTDLKSKLADLTTEINDILTQKQQKNDIRNELIKKKEQFNYEELQLNSQLRDILVKLDELSSQQRESNKQKKLRENVSMLKRFFPKGAIKGLVYDLVRPSKLNYEAALLTILGRNFDSVIVETTSIAYKCIEILKERRLGIATFIPLDSVVVDASNLNYLRTLHEAVQPGIDIIEYDDKSLEQAIHYVVDNALVVDSIENARKLKWNLNIQLGNHKLVTLDGSVIHRSGLMTGGQQNQKSATSLNWDKNEWKSLNELKEDLTGKLATLQERRPKELEINLIAEEISVLDEKLPMIRNQKSNIERTIQDRQSEIDFQTELSKNFETTIESKRKSIAKVEEDISKVQSKISVLQEKVYGEFCEKYGFINGVEDYESLHGSTLRVRAKERAQYTKAISTLKNKLEFENDRLKETDDRRNRLETQITALEEELLALLVTKQELENSLDNYEAELEVIKSEDVGHADRVKQKLKSTKSIEMEVSETEREISTLGKSITSIEEQTLKTDTERVNLLKNCKIQNINIPLNNGLLDSIPIGEYSDNLVKGIYDIEIDYSDLDDKYKRSYNSAFETEFETKLQTTIDQLERLAPNSKAIERLKEVESKLKEFERDHTLARQAERKVANKFQEVRKKRYDKFMEAFEHISGKIDFIYKELTKSNASPLGGSAYLILEDEDSPYSSGIKYHAMPPMKRFRDMELLSGGEKTMAALALLFAIHSYQPSPFFVLDEVDAALDNSNVSKIASYIRKHAGPNFQFIVISLKNSLFEKSDALVGIYREQQLNSSRTLTLDLREYPEEDIPAAAF